VECAILQLFLFLPVTFDLRLLGSQPRWASAFTGSLPLYFFALANKVHSFALSRSVCQIATSKVSSFDSYCPDTDRHTHRTDRSTWTTKNRQKIKRTTNVSAGCSQSALTNGWSVERASTSADPRWPSVNTYQRINKNARGIARRKRTVLTGCYSMSSIFFSVGAKVQKVR